MDFGRIGFRDVDDKMSKGKYPLFNSLSSSSSSSSSRSYHQRNLASSWFGSNENGEGAKIELMETSLEKNDQSDDHFCNNMSKSVIHIEKEHMFNKVVTPSDVGKLNRLVIPKQHAEKYFPLASSSYGKGLLLNFEDRNGKPWRFRYSYWNSSQSYVMTKGWSRFVKEKKLDAGDIVSFHRGVGELGKGYLYIDWRRRPDTVVHHQQPRSLPNFTFSQRTPLHRSIPWSPWVLRPQGLAAAAPEGMLSFVERPINSYMKSSPVSRRGDIKSATQQDMSTLLPGSHVNHFNNANLSSYHGSYGGGVYHPTSNVIFLNPAVQWPQSGGGVGGDGSGGGGGLVFDSVPVVHGKAAAKRLRLFGVNMECPISADKEEECDMLSSIAPQDPHLSSSSNFPLQLGLFTSLPRGKEKPSSSSSLVDLDM